MTGSWCFDSERRCSILAVSPNDAVIPLDPARKAVYGGQRRLHRDAPLREARRCVDDTPWR